MKHWSKVKADYEALQERLRTLPDRLSYDVMVPFGPLAFMPGKLVHTNELTVLLGDNWFAKCSAKQAMDLVEHRKKPPPVPCAPEPATPLHLCERQGKGNYVDIREEVENEEILTKGKGVHTCPVHLLVEDVLEVKEQEGGEQHCPGILTEEELWARLDELEEQEERLDEQDRISDGLDRNGEDTTSSSSSEEEDKEGDGVCLSNSHHRREGWLEVVPGCHGDGGKAEDGEEDSTCVPTIYFSHTVEPKKVRINTGKNTTLKFSERKEEAKRKKRNGSTSGNGQTLAERVNIRTPADIYRVFVDVVNGELMPRKSILKSRSRENSVCSDTSESSAADFEERRPAGRSLSHDSEATHSDTSEGNPDEGCPPGRAPHMASLTEAFSGTVIEKDPVLPSAIPHLTIAPPALPTIPERKSEELAPEVAQDPPKRVSKFKAARLQQK
ncbi:unconventional prefoldin RPB5 interactor 1-like [Scleropages formosus]|uniref:Unconventional prefoldin RPB5 interactor 1-like n=1 Tax=Scleropages formosus TaxID=113540 RepID=A0A0P7ZE40_SCLFO|nr:unconventional prefoldin RPB5 interactor 1-like [Scleropages formosus]